MWHKKMRWLLVAALALGACGSDDDNGGGGGSGTTVTVSGVVRLLSSDGQSTYEGSDVVVEAWADLNGDGRIGDDERASTTTSEDGTYSLKAPAAAGATLLVRFSSEGYAPVIRTVRLAEVHDLRLDAVLSEMALLRCEAGVCRTEDGHVSVEGVEAAVSGYARAFNPVADTDQFPGPFADDEGNMLVSGVFAVFDLRDELDEPITDLGGQTATIRMEIPRDTWAEIRDIQPGDGQITVPMYSFDEERGIWVREGEGHLEDGTGGLLSEEDLGALRDGSFTGRVYAVAEVSHFSYWNVDWPVEAQTCVTGVVKDEAGRPAAGAQVAIWGETFTGGSGPVVVSEEGRFCLPVPRSEPPGEDLDGDGVAGETYEFLVLVRFDGDTYLFGPYETSEVQATCPTGCEDLGDLVLNDGSLVRAEVCHLTGQVLWDPTAPAGLQAYVYGQSRMISDEDLQSLCGDGTTCQSETGTQPDGSFELYVPMLQDVTVAALGVSSDELAEFHYRGERTFRGCPTGPVSILVALESCYVNLPTVTFDPATQEISWDPNVPAATLAVMDAATNQPKWLIVAAEDNGTFSGPVTYGQVPPGAAQAYPPSGSPAPAATGDMVLVAPPDNLIEYQGTACSAHGVGVVP